MEKEIKLEANVGRLADSEPFILAENEKLTLTLKSDYSALYLVSLRNGAAECTLSVKGNFEVPEKLLKEGVLEIEVVIYTNGELFKRWHAEPIRILRHKAEYLFNPVMDELIKRLEKLDELNAKYDDLLDKYTAIERELKEVAEIATDVLN